ncbi:MAG: hypothetical protein R2932_04970 [Caldilineaceae bacterium]
METTKIHQVQTDHRENAQSECYTVVLKVGGNELDDESFLYGLAQAVAKIQADGYMPIIVHGGGKAIADYQQRLGLQPQFIEGLREPIMPVWTLPKWYLAG